MLFCISDILAYPKVMKTLSCFLVEIVQFQLLCMVGNKGHGRFLFCVIQLPHYCHTFCWKTYLLPTKLSQHFCKGSIDNIHMDLLLGSILLHLITYLTPKCLHYCSFIVSPVLRGSSKLHSSFQKCWTILVPLIFPINFRISLQVSTKKSTGILLRIALGRMQFYFQCPRAYC